MVENCEATKSIALSNSADYRRVAENVSKLLTKRFECTSHITLVAYRAMYEFLINLHEILIC